MKKSIKLIWDYIVLVIGGILFGIAVEYVLLPLKITTGGFSGIATLAHYLLEIPTEITLIALNVPAFLITAKFLGIKFGLRSLIGMFASSAGVIIGRQFGTLTADMMLAALFGGLLSGLGIALTYKAGGSTGGTDLIAKLINSKAKHINVGEALMIVDGFIVAFLTVVFKDIEIGLYSIVAIFASSKIIDLILLGAEYAKAVFIITKKSESIVQYIHTEIDRTATKIDVIGTYTKEEKDMLVCVVNKKEIPRLKEAIEEIDKDAFVIITAVTEAIGEGFKNKSI